MCRTHVTFVPVKGQGHTWRSKLTYKMFLNFNMFLNISKTSKVFAWNLKDIWRITSKICRSSFITLYCILTKLCPFLSLLIYLQSILDNMSGLFYKFYTNVRIFFKLDSNVYPNWAMCRTHLTLVPALLRTLVGVWIAFSDSSSLFSKNFVV